MSLPNGWIIVDYTQSFSQVSTSNKKVKTKDCNSEGKFPVVDQGQEYICGYIDDQDKIIEVETPLIIFGDHTRIIKWIDFDFVPGADGTKVLKPENIFDPRFFYYQMKSIELPDKGYSRHFKFLKEEDFILPPINEQKRIAQKLDELLATVESIKTRLDNAPTIIKRFRQSILAAATSGKLTEEWREENGITEKWREEEAQNICEKVQSGSTPKNRPFEQDGSIPFLKVYNIKNQKIDFDYKPQFITQTVHETSIKRSIALPNDVLMNIVGPPLGKIAILTDQYPEWNLNQAITIFRPKEDELDYKYLYYYLCEGKVVRDIVHDLKGMVGQVNISLTQCRESIIPVPPIEEQKEIVSQVESLFTLADTLEEKIEAAKKRVDKLTQSILAKAFRGELVPQDPNDESAEVLLERIKGEG